MLHLLKGLEGSLEQRYEEIWIIGVLFGTVGPDLNPTAYYWP